MGLGIGSADVGDVGANGDIGIFTELKDVIGGAVTNSYNFV